MHSGEKRAPNTTPPTSTPIVVYLQIGVPKLCITLTGEYLRRRHILIKLHFNVL